MPYKDKETRKEYSIQRPCSVCKGVKLKSEFNPFQHRCKDCQSKNLHKCCKCKEVKYKSLFPSDSSKKEGISSYCKICKISKKRVTPTIRLRWLFKGSLKRLQISKNGKTFEILGFTKSEFLSKFPNIPPGKSLDHCIPLSWFKEDCPVSVSCNLHNLQLLDNSVNFSKKNIFYHNPSDSQYLTESLKYIKKQYLHNFKN